MRCQGERFQARGSSRAEIEIKRFLFPCMWRRRFWSRRHERYAALESLILAEESEARSNELTELQSMMGHFKPYFCHRPDEGPISICPTATKDIVELIKIHTFLGDVWNDRGMIVECTKMDMPESGRLGMRGQSAV